MITENLNPDVQLIASPYDLRTSLSEKVSETDTRSAIEPAIGDLSTHSQLARRWMGQAFGLLGG